MTLHENQNDLSQSKEKIARLSSLNIQDRLASSTTIQPTISLIGLPSHLPTSHPTPPSTRRALTSSGRYTRRTIAPTSSSSSFPARDPCISTAHSSRQSNTLRSLAPKQLRCPIESWCVCVVHAGEGAVTTACWELHAVSYRFTSKTSKEWLESLVGEGRRLT